MKRNTKASLDIKNNQLGGKKYVCVLKMAIVGNGRVKVLYFENSLKKQNESFIWYLKQLVENRDFSAEDLHIFQTRCFTNTPPGDGNVTLLNPKGYP